MSRLYLSPPHMGARERELLLEAFDSNWIAPLGPQVDAFEAEVAALVGRKHGVALASGTAALHLALRYAGVGPGDTVMVSDLTFVATVNPIRYLGATPIFIDSDESWTMDPVRLEEALGEAQAKRTLPKAIVPVDLYGQCADYERLGELAERFGVSLIADAAESLGARFADRPAGSFGQAAILSFNGNKIITTSGGGMLVTDNGEMAAKIRHWSTQAREPSAHYEHVEMGYNYRLSNLLAAVGRGQLEVLGDRARRRRAHNSAYREALGDLPGLHFMLEAPGRFTTFWLTTLTIDPALAGFDREAVRLALEAEDIEARPVWKPMHLQPLYRDCAHYGGAVGDQLFAQGLCLPSGSSMTDTERDRVIAIVRRVAGR